MSLKSDLQQHMKDAMRAKDTAKLGVVRYLISEIRNWEIDNGEADDQAVLAVIKRQVKQLKDGIQEFQNGGRMDLVEAEQAKLVVLQSYLPAQMSDDELTALVAAAIAELPEVSMGAAMKAAMAKVAGQADGSRVSAEVKKQLAN